MKTNALKIAMISIHSSPLGDLGTKDTGGMSVYIRELALALARLGHSIDIYTRSLSIGSPQIVELHENVRLVHLCAGIDKYIPKLTLHRHLADFFYDLEDFRTGRRLQYDLVHSHYWLSGCLGHWAQQQWHVPHVIKFHTLGLLKNIAEVSEQEPEMRITVEKNLVKSCHLILVAAAKEKENLIKYYGAPHDKIAVIPCGVNLSRFHPIAKAAARRSLGFTQDESIVLFVGRFDPLKGLERLLAAITHLQHHQRLRLVIVGGEDYQVLPSQKLRNLTRKLGIQDSVTFAGRVQQNALPCYYSAADVLVVPSYYESFGLVALESLACGTPVIATAVGAMESIIQESKTGQIVMNPSPGSLSGAIQAFITKTQKLSSDAIRASVLKYNWPHVALAVKDQYMALLQGQQNAKKFTFLSRQPSYAY